MKSDRCLSKKLGRERKKRVRDEAEEVEEERINMHIFSEIWWEINRTEGEGELIWRG